MHMMRHILADSGWYRLGLQDRQTAVFVLPGGGVLGESSGRLRPVTVGKTVLEMFYLYV